MVKTKTRSIDKWSDFLSPVFLRFTFSFLCSALLFRSQLDFLNKKDDCFKQMFELSCRRLRGRFGDESPPAAATGDGAWPKTSVGD